MDEVSLLSLSFPGLSRKKDRDRDGTLWGDELVGEEGEAGGASFALVFLGFEGADLALVRVRLAFPALSDWNPWSASNDPLRSVAYPACCALTAFSASLTSFFFLAFSALAAFRFPESLAHPAPSLAYPSPAFLTFFNLLGVTGRGKSMGFTATRELGLFRDGVVLSERLVLITGRTWTGWSLELGM